MTNGFGLQWHITNMCDQRCKHCYIFNSEGRRQDLTEVSLENSKMVIKKFVTFCNKLNKFPFITITGGDPLLHKEFWDIVEYLKFKNIKFSILGNPFHLDDVTAKTLHEYGCNSYQMSIDGLELTHDYIRKSGSFCETIDKIPIIKKSGMKANIMTTVSSLNIDEIPSVARIVSDAKASIFTFARYCPTHGDNEYNISPQRYKVFMNEMWNVFSELASGDTVFTLKDHLWTLFLHEKGMFNVKNDNIVYEGCNCGISHMTVLEDCTVYACRRFESPVGNLKSEDFETIFFGNKMSEYRQIEKIEKCNECTLLNYCRGCRAVPAGLTGDYFKPDPQCWKGVE